jgi:anti-sigma regulatory factor (Ser/Thr protein kinase)
MQLTADQRTASTRHYRIHLAASDSGVGRARRAAGRLLDSWGLGDTADTATLLVSELLTNVLVHVGPGVQYSLTVAHDGRRLLVEVRDPSPRLPVLRGGDDEDAEFGRGLAMVDCMADTWGCTPLPPGKVVWFHLNLS